MRTNFFKILLLGAASLALSGVRAQTVVDANVPTVVDRAKFFALPATPFQPIVPRRADSPAGIFNSGVIFLADQLDRNKVDELSSKPIIVASFSSLDNLAETTSFGRLIGEHLIHELTVRGWRVIDLRLTKSVIVNPQGEFSLSRDLNRLRDSFPVASILVGTYSRTSDGVVVSARVIDLESGKVQTSAQSRFIGDRFVQHLVSIPVVYPAIKIGN